MFLASRAAWSLITPMVRASTKVLCCFWLLDWAERGAGGIVKIPRGYLWNPSLGCLGFVVQLFFMKSFWIPGLKVQNISWDWNCKTSSEHINAEVDCQVGTPHQKVDSGKKWMMESIQWQTHNRKGAKRCFFCQMNHNCCLIPVTDSRILLNPWINTKLSLAKHGWKMTYFNTLYVSQLMIRLILLINKT